MNAFINKKFVKRARYFDFWRQKNSLNCNSTAVSAGSATVVVSSDHKVSITVTPSGVTLATLANSMPVTVVTQALGQ